MNVFGTTGAERRAWLDRQGQNALDAIQYYAGPGINVNALAQVADMFNPVADIGRAGTAARGVVRPGATISERVGALGNVATDMASVLAPVAGAAYADDAARGLVEGLANWSMPADDMATRFIASEAGSVGPKTAAEAQAQDILDLLASGRASEVTDEMMAAADPQYLYRNYDLPMDEASRMARADQYFPRDSAHGTGVDILAVDNERLIGGQFWSTDDLQAIADREVGAAGRGVTIPLRLNVQNPAGWREYDQLGVDEMIGRGYDGMALKDEPSLMNPGTRTTYVTFNPNQVRSRFTRFDPRLAHLRTLSAGVGGISLAAAMSSPEDLEAYLAGY